MERDTAASALSVNWTVGQTLPDQNNLNVWMRPQQSAGILFTVNSGDTDQMLATAIKTVAAQYWYPFQMHGSLASSCAVADVQGGTGSNATATIWSATQGLIPNGIALHWFWEFPLRMFVLFFMEGSGCYGLNGNDSVSFDAALLSQAVGKPVRVQYSRKDEMASGESFGPAHVMNLSAGIDGTGQMVVWSFEGWSLPRVTVQMRLLRQHHQRSAGGIPNTAADRRRGDAAYDIRQ